MDGVRNPNGPELTWGDDEDGAGVQWLPPPQYAAYLEGRVPGLAGLLSNTTAAQRGASISEGRTPLESFLYALLWGMVHVSGIGFNLPDDPRGATCCFLVALAAIATNATLIGSVTTTLTRINAYDSKELRSRESISAFLTENQVPRPRASPATTLCAHPAREPAPTSWGWFPLCL